LILIYLLFFDLIQTHLLLILLLDIEKTTNITRKYKIIEKG